MKRGILSMAWVALWAGASCPWALAEASPPSPPATASALPPNELWQGHLLPGRYGLRWQRDRDAAGPELEGTLQVDAQLRVERSLGPHRLRGQGRLASSSATSSARG